MPNNQLFDLLGPLYDHIFSIRDADQLLDPLKLPASGWLLDLGGGTGRSSIGLTDQVDLILVCDLSMSMLQSAQKKGVQYLVQASATDLPFSAESFERIMVIDALHHMPDQKNTVGEMTRLLKPGGRLLIEEPDIRFFAVKLIALAEKLMLMRSKFHTPVEIQSMAEGYDVTASIGTDGQVSAWIMVEK